MDDCRASAINIVVGPTQGLLFCPHCGGWGTVERRNLNGSVVISSCPNGCHDAERTAAMPDVVKEIKE